MPVAYEALVWPPELCVKTLQLQTPDDPWPPQLSRPYEEQEEGDTYLIRLTK